MNLGMCSSLPCLKTRWDRVYTVDQLFSDRIGYSWCPQCRVRGELLNWSLTHGSPEIRAGRSMVGPGKLWEVAMIIGSDALVEAIRQVVWPHRDEEEEAA